MKVKVSLSIGPEQMKEAWLDIPDKKLTDLPEEELEAVVEIYVRKWLDEQLSVTWEVVE
ncbi:hypothetical protein [Paenibacillus sp. HJGM_3]|uniref:hypothetical protein n=1 Tax=Paenibacillus sp. HJGM_3 TaxID=3379816 RepID=UPI00385B749D